ncbi:serine proteinase stubble [Arctopsyche grandis]|uniref:serine proteinase stubble n=1 Tax=Arctopsyche grandis TaxID=121162 RepID=UPI00406D7614
MRLRIKGVGVMTWWWAVLVAMGAAPLWSAAAQGRPPGYQISRKPCSVGGARGTCMFVQDCLRGSGRHVGVCVDGFMFGSCCALGDPPPAGPEAPPTPSYPDRSTTVTNYRPMVTVTRPYRPALSQDHNQTKAPSSGSPSSLSTRPHNNRPTFVTKPAGGRPGPKPNINYHNNYQRPLSATSPGALGHRPLLATSPSNKISSSPSLVGSGQRGTARPITSNTINDIEPQASIGLGGAWSSRPGVNVNTVHWQATTEANFITKPRPVSWEKPSTGRPKPTKKFTTTTQKPPTTKTSPHPKPYTAKPASHKPLKASTASPPTTYSAQDGHSSSAGYQSTYGSTVAPANNNGILSPSSSPALGSIVTTAATKDVECGVPAMISRPETRIVGGKDASFGRWPWQVSVRRTSFFGFSSTHRCGGALLNHDWIATAGHCVDDLLLSQIRIRVGEYDFSNVQEDYPFVERGAARKAVHPKYNFFTYEYDLALVRLEAPVDFAPHISPVCLPASDDLLVGENATVTGWGRLSEGGSLPSVLQEVQVPIVSNDRCKSMFLRAGRHEFIPEIFLCAGHERGGQDSCQGDSGGPLQVKGSDGRYFLAGIISWGIGCAEANLPGVCTRISKFVPWILETVT